MEDSKLRKVYDTIVKEGYDVPDFATFETDMRDDKKLTLVRDRLVEDGYELPDFEQFKVDMFGTPASAPANPTFTAQQLEIQDKRKRLYDGLVAAGYDAGADFKDFNNLMDSDEVARQWVYNTAKSEGWNVGESFDQFVGYITPTPQNTFTASKTELNDNASTKWLYDNLTAKGYNVGKDIEEFESLIVNNEESRQWVFETARNLGWNVGKDYNEFTSLVAPATSQNTFTASKPELNDNVKKLYDALLKKGYTTYDLGDENIFREKMSDKNNRKELYDWVSSRGDFGIGDYESYEKRLSTTPQTQEVPQLPEINNNAYTFSSQELEIGLSILTTLIILVVWYKLIKRAK